MISEEFIARIAHEALYPRLHGLDHPFALPLTSQLHLCCNRIANNRLELDVLSQSQDFLHDWYMEALVKQARDKLGLLRPGYVIARKQNEFAGPHVDGGPASVARLGAGPEHMRTV